MVPARSGFHGRLAWVGLKCRPISRGQVHATSWTTNHPILSFTKWNQRLFTAIFLKRKWSIEQKKSFFRFFYLNWMENSSVFRKFLLTVIFGLKSGSAPWCNCFFGFLLSLPVSLWWCKIINCFLTFRHPDPARSKTQLRYFFLF